MHYDKSPVHFNISCIYRHAAELNETLGQSPTQQAIVQSFLKNYDKVIAVTLYTVSLF